MMKEYPLVSIGLPVYNSEKTIRRALDSLLEQRYPNFEIIVSDNASNDKTTEICRKYAQRDKRIKFNLNEKNLGISANFQIVHSKAAGKYFMMAGGDDFWKPQFVPTLVKILESDPNVGVALCSVRREYSDGRLRDVIKFDKAGNPNNLSKLQIAAKLFSPKQQIKDLKYNLFICGLFRNEAIKGVLSLDDDILTYGDRAFLVPIALGYTFRYVDKELMVKTIYESCFKKRYTDDEFVQKKKEHKYWEYYFRMIEWITKSPNIPVKRKLFVFFILYYLTYRWLCKLKKKF
jgi:glycosyltransferase involved in cell wall biosynthesis